jgi:WD40 repeat protein
LSFSHIRWTTCSLFLALVAGYGMPPSTDQSEKKNPEIAREIVRFQQSVNYRTLAFSPDGRCLAIAQDDSLVIRELTAAKIIATQPWPQSTGRCWNIRFSESGKQLVSIHGSLDKIDPGTMHLWDFADGHHVRVVTTFKPNWSLGYRPRIDSDSGGFGEVLIESGANHPHSPPRSRTVRADGYTVYLDNLENGESLFQVGFPQGVHSTSISPDERLVAINQERGTLIVNGITGAVIGWWDVRGPIVFSPDSKRIVWCEGDNIVVRSVADVVAHAKTPPEPIESDPPNAPLHLELVSKSPHYKFTNTLAENGGQSPIRVDMELLVRNVGSTELSLCTCGLSDVFLLGSGAKNERYETCVGESQDGDLVGAEKKADVQPPKLAPGQCHRIPLREFKRSGADSRWTEPGEYFVYVSCYVTFERPTTDKQGPTKEEVRLFARPVQVKVVKP